MNSIEQELQDLRTMMKQYKDKEISTTHAKTMCIMYEQTHKREKLLFAKKCSNN